MERRKTKNALDSGYLLVSGRENRGFWGCRGDNMMSSVGAAVKVEDIVLAYKNELTQV